MLLPLKTKTSSDYFVPFVESTLTFRYFEKKDDRLSLFIMEITDSERVGYTAL